MARLIPRKQIEEQQNITGSLTIGKNVNVGNNAIVSGSLFVSESFFMGTNINTKSEITSSLYLTGSLIIDGLLKAGAPNTLLAVTSSNALLSVDTTKYAGILARDFGANVPTLYVSATDGDDTNDGRSIQFPLRTIKRAAQLATPGYDGRYGLDPNATYNGYVIRVQAGTYHEDNPVIMPKNSTIWGSGLRITKILAKNKGEDLFWVNSGCYVAEVTVGGLRLAPDQINPTKGFGFAFQPGAFITTSPYIQNCSQISNQENSFAELYEDIPPGGGGLYVNGDVIHPDSPLASMVLDAYTQISPNGVGCLVNGRGFIQLVSFFNNFSYYAIRVNNGGHATLNNSNISFGLYGMYASGSRLISGSGGDLISRNSIRSTWSCIVDVLHKGYPAGLPTSSILNTDAGIKITTEPQFFLSAGQTASQADVDEVNADFTLISEIVKNGTANFPTLLAKSSNKGYGANSPFNILGETQITSSIGAGDYELNHISQSVGALLGIFANGTGSYAYNSNTSASISVSGITPIQSAIVATDIVTGSVSSSFETVISLIKNGLSKTPTVISNASASIMVSDVSQFTTGESSSLAVVNLVSASFSIVYNILANGTGSSILDIPENEQVEFNISNTNSSSYHFEGLGENPTLTLFRGETYKFHVSASDSKGPNTYPFWIRKQPIAGISTDYDYNDGVVNNGDEYGNITFTVPYNAPNELYYICQNSANMVGKFHIVNSSVTPIDLIQSTLTYPQTIYSSSFASEEADVLNAYDQLTNNLALIQAETLAFVSSSWSGVYYDQTKCSRDIAYIVNGVAKDLLYGGNEESVRSGLYYYLYPSQATGYEKSATLTAVKYASQLALNLIENKTLVMPDSTKEAVAQCIVDNREFVQKETIAYLSSSWSGGDGFVYNEASCSRDVGYILDAVATDLKYGGNERSITAAQYYYLYPSVATAAGVPSSAKQLEPTLNGIRFAAGVVLNLIKNKTFNTAIATTKSTYDLLRANKELIQNETIQYIGVAYPQLTYNTDKCRRDVGYIIDAIATDLLYGGNERSVIAGNNYYNYPSVATSTQKKETSGAIRYTKIISDYIVQNIVLDTPRVVNNDEKRIKVTNLNNYTSSFSGTLTESGLISSSFTIVEGIIKRGLDAIPSLVAQNNGENWSISNPLSVTPDIQILNGYSTPAEINKIGSGFDIVNNIIGGGLNAVPTIVKNTNTLTSVTSTPQQFGVSATSVETASISSSFGVLENIIINGVNVIPSFVSNTTASIKVTSTPYNIGTAATSTESNLVSSSIVTIENIVTNGLSVLPTLVDNVHNHIKVSSVSQTATSGSLEDVNFISQSISIITQIIETGNVDLFPKTTYVSSSNSILVYNTLKNNIPFIQAETIAYLSSSWSGFVYDEAKCRRDVGLIISGAAEDYLFNANSASVVSGQFYYEVPSQAPTAQLNQTLDGINYASRLAQKIIQNVTFVAAPTDVQNAVSSLRANRTFIQDETIAYMSSSWGSFDYNEAKCRRDVGYIIDAATTDLLYGGNERSRQAGIYYYLYPSQANNTQLQQTVDGVRYASRIAQNVVLGKTFTTADTNKLNASNNISLNKNFIADEVVAYVSSSWSGVFYNEAKCKRDVGYLLDAVRTDLVYGGNERTRLAGLYYFLYPSSATVAGVPSSTAQLDPTITGIDYASRMAQNVVLNNTFTKASEAKLNAKDLVKAKTTLIQQNTIDFISQNYPYLNYNTDKCFRDVRFIIDGVLTDLIYGGNERSVTSGVYYYKFPNKATDNQVTETISSLQFARDLTKLIAIGDVAIESSFDNIINIVESGSLGKPTLVENTAAGIKGTQLLQYTSSNLVSNDDIINVSSSFANVINIIGNGVDVIPAIVTNSNRGVFVSSSNQITSSANADTFEINKVSKEFDVIINIISGGLNLLPKLNTNASSSIKVTNTNQYIGTSTISSSLVSLVTQSFDIVNSIINIGTGSLPALVDNTIGLVKITNSTQYSASAVSNYTINSVSSSFDTILNIITNGTGSLPNVVSNVYSNIAVSGVPQYISASNATTAQATAISQSIGIVVNIIANGLSAVPTIYSSSISNNQHVIDAYNILTQNIPFIEAETVAYLSSSWVGFNYDQEKCKRDVGLIISGAAFDLLFNANSASVVSGKTYFEIPSQATTYELTQTLEGIRYASELAQTVVLNTQFVSASIDNKNAYNLLHNNRSFIQNEVIAYVSSSWSFFNYNEAKCKRDVGYIIDAVATDILYGGNERSVEAGMFYYMYPSQATGVELDATLTGVRYAKNLAYRLLKGGVFQNVSQNKLDAYKTLMNNKPFIQNEVIAFISSSWSNFVYNQASCSRDVSYIIDAAATDMVYGGNERARQAGIFYYKYPSQATGAELAPTLTGVNYAKGLAERVLQNVLFETPVSSSYAAYNLLVENKEFIQNETMAFLNSAWSFYNYNKAKCRRDVGYMIDAVATDILYGGNERVREAGRYYYLYPSLATVGGNGQSAGELGQTLDGVYYAKGLAEKIVSNIVLQSPTDSEKAAYELLLNNKAFIQKETITFLSSSWSGVDGFSYNEASCSRDVAYIVDAVATDLLYGGNQRSSKAGQYYYLYPSRAIVGGSASPDAQLDQTITGVRFAAGITNKIVSNIELIEPTYYVSSSVSLLKENKTLIQNETIAYVDAFYPYLVYNKAKCRRDVGYIIDAVATDLWYGGNERSIVAGDYYYRYPNLATKAVQLTQTVNAIDYAKSLAKIVAQNIQLAKPTIGSNTDANIAVTNTTQYTSSLNVNQTEITKISSSFAIVTDIIGGGVQSSPTKVLNTEAGIKVTGLTPTTSSINGGDEYADLVTSSFNLVRDIIYYGEAGIPDALARNYDYGFELSIPNITYSQSSIFGNQKSASFDGMTNGIYDEIYEIGTDNVNPEEWIQMDLGSVAKVNKVVIGADYDTTLIDYYSKAYTEDRNVQYSIDGTTWTTVFNTGVFTQPIQTYDVNINARYIRIVAVEDWLAVTEFYALVDNTTIATPNPIPSLLHISSTEQITGNTPIIGDNQYEPFKLTLGSVDETYKTIVDIVNNGTGSIPTIIENTSSSINVTGGTPYQAPLAGTQTDIDKIGNGFGIVMDIIKGNYPTTLVSNTYNAIKVTDTPQLISGSGAERLQAKLVSSSFAVVSNIILNGTGSQTYVAPSATANSNPKITSAYNLLVSNSLMIIDETISYMSSSWSTFYYDEVKCRRDLGYIINGAAYDLLYGGNSGSFLNGQFYSLVPSPATSSQLDQTLTAIRYASGLAEKVVRNTVLTHISASAETTASYSSLVNNKQFIQNEVIAYISSSWSTSSFNYTEASCSRDVAYIVDAVATDLLYGGNERSYVAGDYYYRYPSVATTSQLQPTLDGVGYAKGVAMNLASNVTFSTPHPDTQYSYDLLLANKEFIQNETIAFVNVKYPNLYYNETKCRRDVGYIVDAAATDLLYKGNQRAAIAGEFYFKYPSIATDVQLTETTVAINYAKRLSISVIKSDIIATPQIVSNTFNNIRVTNIPQYVSASSSATTYEVNRVSSSFSIVNTIIENGLVATPTFVSNVSESIYVTLTPQIGGIAATQTEADYVSSSISIVTDIIQNGTGSFPVLNAYGAASTDPNVLNAYNNLIQNIPFIQSETIAYISSSWSFFNYNEASCSRDVAYIVNGAAEDLLHNSTSASFMNGYYYFLFPSNATVIGDGDGVGQLGQTLDGVNYASRLAQQIVLGTTFVSPSTERKIASELLKLNKSFIAAETVAYISSSWVTGSNSDEAFIYNDLSCSRDVNYILDNVATDILYGGNERTIKAGSYYFLYPSQATGSQIDETLEGIKYAGELAQKVVLNTVFTQPNATASAVYETLKANKAFIQNETIAFVSSSWVGFDYKEAKCKRDVGYIVDAVATDILYGGNQRSATAGQYYFKYPSQATDAQIDSTLNAIDFAGGTAKNVITNKTFVTASNSVSASVELLRNNRLFIQNETMAYLTASWSSFEYNQASCSRDIGYIVDGVATDILYGGNERSVMSGDFYYKYPSKATLLGDGDGVGQLGQTLDGIIYGSRIAQKVAQNIQFVTASSAVSASFDLLRKNKNFIAAETIAYVSSSWSGVYYNEASCSRDVQYIIDAAATDLLYGGQERAITAGTYYYIFPSKATKSGVPSESNQLDPTITGVKYGGRLASKVILNPTFQYASQSAVYGKTLLVGNRKFIQKETLAFLSSSWSTLEYNEASCSRDLGFIIDAVATDLIYGGNERSTQAGSYYYLIPSVAIQPSYTANGKFGQKQQTADGINYAAGISNKLIVQTQLVQPTAKKKAAAQRLLASKKDLAFQAISYTNGAFPYLVYNEASCSRDVGLIIDACVTDLLYGGNERGIAAASSYYTGQYGSAKAVTNDQLLETLETNRYLRTRAEFIVANAPLETFGSLIVATGIDYSYNGAGVTFKALPPNQGGNGVADPAYYITELGGGRIYFTSGDQNGNFNIGTGLTINQSTGTLVGRTFNKSLFALVTPYSLALQI